MDAQTSRRATRSIAVVALVLVAGVVGAGVALVVSERGDTAIVKTVTRTQTATIDTASTGSPATVARLAVPGVVSVEATTTVTVGGEPFSPPRTQPAVASGAGFVLDKQGNILTAQHVIADATAIHVSFADGHKVHAKLLGSDPLLDLAVLSVRVPAATLHPLPLGSADELQIGDPVVAIGSPFGFDRSISAGVVSALEREMVAPNGFTVSDAIQTDAAINHGNSGGPLLDTSGKVVGVADQIADSGVDANVGVGFAVAIDSSTRQAISTLEASGAVTHAWLGVSLAEIDAILGTSDRVATNAGALVTGVTTGGPADMAGLQGGSQIATIDGATYCVGGDIITAVAADTVTTAGELQRALNAHRPGDTIAIGVIRADGTKTRLKVTLGNQPTSASATTSGCG